MGHVIKTESGYNVFAEDIGTGVPVVFIHGWPVNHKMFEYQMNELRSKATVSSVSICLDLVNRISHGTATPMMRRQKQYMLLSSIWD